MTGASPTTTAIVFKVTGVCYPWHACGLTGDGRVGENTARYVCDAEEKRGPT